MGDKATPEAFTKEREARAKYLECLSRGKGYTDPWWHGGVTEPPKTQLPTPAEPPPPVGVITPVVIPPPTKQKPKSPCDEGDTQDVASCECEVNLALVAGVKIEYGEAYQMNKGDVEKALKGLETFLSVTAVATKLQGFLTEPVEIVSNMIDHISTETAADSTVDGLKELNEKLEKFKNRGKSVLPTIVTFPIAMIGFSSHARPPVNVRAGSG